MRCSGGNIVLIQPNLVMDISSSSGPSEIDPAIDCYYTAVE